MSNRVHSRKKKEPVIQGRSFAETIFLLFPLLLVVTCLPLIIKMHTYDPKLNIYDFFPNTTELYDFFLFYKQWVFFGIGCLMVAIILVRAWIRRDTIKCSKYLIPLAVYAALAILSSIFAKDKLIAVIGGVEQFENVFCLVGYALIVYYAFLILETEYELKLLINAVAIGALLLGIIGTLQAFGMDPFDTMAGKAMIAERGFDPANLAMTTQKGRVYLTFINPNYVGVYTSFMIPLFSVMLIFAKKISEYVLYSLVVITNVISLFGSQSKAGFISIAFAFIMLIITYRKYIFKKWYIIASIFGTLVISFIVINVINDNVYMKAIADAFKIEKIQAPDTQSIEINTNVELTYKNNKLIVGLSPDHDLILQDTTPDVIKYETELNDDGEEVAYIQDERFSDITIANYRDSDILDFCLFIGKEHYAFSKHTKSGEYLFYNRYGRFSPIETPKSVIFDGYETFASGRGFIWSRTIPLLKDYIVLGAGADNFLFCFPQYDYVGFNNYDFDDGFLYKPHSWYLQVAIQTGLISLIALLVFFGIYLVQSFRLYVSCDITTKTAQIGFAIFICTISFLISSISNDSTITVSPVFWAILGIGFAANMMERKARNVVETVKE